MNTVPDRSRLFALNLVVLLLAGVLLSFWTLYYTEAFPVVGGLLGLTGVFAWIAFIAGILTDERKSSLQTWFDRTVLQSNVPWLLTLVGLIVFGVLVVARTGTLVIDTSGDEMSRAVSVTPANSRSEEDALPFHMSAQSQRQQLLRTGWLRPASYRVRASGLPDVYVEVRPAARSEITLPDAALSAPVILVRPDLRLGVSAAGGDFRLTVTRNGKPFGEIADFKGTTAWIGARRDVVVPQRLIDRWRMEDIPDNALDDVLSRWRWPVALADAPGLAFGDRLRISIVNRSDPSSAHSVCPNVVLPASRMEFPQEVIIHAGDNC